MGFTLLALAAGACQPLANTMARLRPLPDQDTYAPQTNETVRAVARAIPPYRVAAVRIEELTDFRGKALVVRDSLIVGRIVRLLQNATISYPYAQDLSAPRQCPILLDVDSNELMRPHVHISPSNAFGPAWGDIIDAVEQDQARQLSAALASIPGDVYRVTVNEKVMITDRAQIKEIIGWLRDAGSALFTYDGNIMPPFFRLDFVATDRHEIFCVYPPLLGADPGRYQQGELDPSLETDERSRRVLKYFHDALPFEARLPVPPCVEGFGAFPPCGKGGS